MSEQHKGNNNGVVCLDVPIAKAEKIGDAYYITGVVMRPSKLFDENGKPTDYKDSHGNWARVEEIKKACYKAGEKIWAQKLGVDKQHDKKYGRGVVIENYITKTDIPELNAKVDDWVSTIKITDPKMMEAIDKGEITAFSVGGNALIIPEEQEGETNGAEA